MMAPKWTPGPWETRPGNKSIFVVQPHQFIEHGIYVAEVSKEAWHPMGLEEMGAARDANAHLIAAAPELYEALAFVECGFCHNQIGYTGPGTQPLAERDWRGCPTCSKARAALAKARGEA